MTKLEKEYRKVKAHLDPIKKRAQDAPEIRKATRAFRRSLAEKMFQLEPRVLGWRGRSRVLEEEIRAARQEKADDEAVDELVHELDEIREKVDRVEAQARTDEALVKERTKLRQRVFDKMNRLDSRVPEWLAQRRTIVQGLKRGTDQ